MSLRLPRGLGARVAALSAAGRVNCKEKSDKKEKEWRLSRDSAKMVGIDIGKLPSGATIM